MCPLKRSGALNSTDSDSSEPAFDMVSIQAGSTTRVAGSFQGFFVGDAQVSRIAIKNRMHSSRYKFFGAAFWNVITWKKFARESALDIKKHARPPKLIRHF